MAVCRGSSEIKGVRYPCFRFRPLFLVRFLDWLDRSPRTQSLSPETKATIKTAAARGRLAMDSDFGKEHDTFRLVGQDNLRRYRVAPDLTMRVQPHADVPAEQVIEQTIIAVAAAVAVSAQFVLSIDPAIPVADQELLESIADWLPGLIAPLPETSSQLAERIQGTRMTRIRSITPLPLGEVRDACGERFVTIIEEPVLVDARIECLRYLNEQSISHDYHRYGDLGRRQVP